MSSLMVKAWKKLTSPGDPEVTVARLVVGGWSATASRSSSKGRLSNGGWLAEGLRLGSERLWLLGAESRLLLLRAEGRGWLGSGAAVEGEEVALAVVELGVGGGDDQASHHGGGERPHLDYFNDLKIEYFTIWKKIYISSRYQSMELKHFFHWISNTSLVIFFLAK